MKILLVMFLTFVSIVCQAQTVEKNDKGEYRVVPENSEWQPIGITAQGEAGNYPEYFSEAIANPGEPITIQEEKRVMRYRLVFKKLVKVERKQIVYDDSIGTISLVESEEQREEKSSLIIMFFLSIVSMITSNLLSRKKITLAVFVATFMAFAVAGIAAAIVCFDNGSAITLAAFAAAAFIVATIDVVKEYRIFSSLYYVFMVIAIILLFI